MDALALVDDTVLSLVAEAFAMMDAEILELKENLATLAQIGAHPLPAPLPEGVAPEQLAALLRHHRIQYQEVYDEVYFDELDLQRVRPKAVPRPATVDDILGQREDENGVWVVLRDGRRHRLNYTDKEIT